MCALGQEFALLRTLTRAARTSVVVTRLAGNVYASHYGNRCIIDLPFCSVGLVSDGSDLAHSHCEVTDLRIMCSS